MTKLVGRQCILTRQDGFCLYGRPLEITVTYVLFTTNQKTSYIGWGDIRSLCPDPKYQSNDNYDRKK
jgi:hypothetical protein